MRGAKLAFGATISIFDRHFFINSKNVKFLTFFFSFQIFEFLRNKNFLLNITEENEKFQSLAMANKMILWKWQEQNFYEHFEP